MYEVLLIKYFTPCYRINSALLTATVVSNSECQRDLFSASTVSFFLPSVQVASVCTHRFLLVLAFESNTSALPKCWCDAVELTFLIEKASIKSSN